MKMQPIAVLVFVGLLTLGLKASPQETRATSRAKADKSSVGIPAEQFAKLHKRFMPQPGESLWEKINWERDLLKARKRAAAEGKPIYFFVAHGDSVGTS